MHLDAPYNHYNIYDPGAISTLGIDSHPLVHNCRSSIFRMSVTTTYQRRGREQKRTTRAHRDVDVDASR